MLREVVAEAAFDARRALVGGVELDVGGRHADHFLVRDVQVDLAADAAVRAHRPDDALRMPHLLGREALPRHHLEDRPGGAYPDALPAPGTPRLVGIAVRPDDDLDVLAALGHVEHPHHLDVLARPHAARAQDAGAHVDRKSTRLNSSHGYISYAVFCLKKKKKTSTATPPPTYTTPTRTRQAPHKTSPSSTHATTSLTTRSTYDVIQHSLNTTTTETTRS